jgi:predicted phosphodiesterase
MVNVHKNNNFTVTSKRYPMFRKWMQKILKKPVTWMAEKLSSSPNQEAISRSLTDLLDAIRQQKTDRGIIIPFDITTGRFIILSDQHKGGKDAADDFMPAETNYLQALRHYYDNGYTFISLGDSEELWENTPKTAIEKNRISLLEEAKFLQVDRYYRIFGNHDLEWKYPIQQNLFLKPIFGDKLKVYEGICLATNHNNQPYTILLSHGHQGDQKSDGNPLSTWAVAALWTPIQRYLEVTINTPATSFELTDQHNIMMYQWSAQQNNLVFISGHTHKPVFASLDHIERLNKQLEHARQSNNNALIEKAEKELQFRSSEYAGKIHHKTMVKPSYFNAGCCCFGDGDITGIEISEGYIRLVKWHAEKGNAVRIVLEESELGYIFEELQG